MPDHAVTTVDDVTALSGRSTHSGCSKAVVHQVAPSETSVFHVKPGGVIRNHTHSRVWDLFLGVSGEGEIVYEEGGTRAAFALRPNAFCGIPPGVRHEVVNRSAGTDLVFVLVHAPWEGYDHVPAR